MVKAKTARAAPADMSLTLIATASSSETLFTSPVASLTKTDFFEAMKGKWCGSNVFRAAALPQIFFMRANGPVRVHWLMRRCRKIVEIHNMMLNACRTDERTGMGYDAAVSKLSL